MDDYAPATREEADQQNVIGNRNREAVGLPYWRQVQTGEQKQNVQVVEQNPYNPLLQPGRYTNWQNSHPEATAMPKSQAEYQYAEYVANRRRYAVENRAGYTPPEQLGDTRTQAAVKGVEMLRLMGYDVPSREEMTGRILEAQRQAAQQTPDTRDDRYYEGEMSKWGQNYVEKSSAQHFYLKDTNQVGTNEFETQGDLAVEWLKGSPDKRSERFSPLSGMMAPYLPNDTGLQERGWNRALGRTQPNVSYMDSVMVLGGSRGSLFDSKIYRPEREKKEMGGMDGFGILGERTTETSTFRPSDATLSAMSIWGGQNSNPIARGMAGLFDFFTQGSMIKTKETTRNLPEITRITGRASSMLQNGTIMETTFFETTGGKQINTQTTTTPMPTGFDIWYTGAEKKASSALGFDKLPELTTEQIQKVSPIIGAIPGAAPFAVAMQIPVVKDYAAGYLKGEYEGLKTQPIKTIGFLGLGIGMGGLFKGAEVTMGVARASMAEKVISSGGMWRAVDVIGNTAMTRAPQFLAGLYAIDVGGRSTNWGTDFSPKAAERLGGIVSTESRPMGIGFGIGYKAPGSIADAARTSDINFKSAMQEGTTKSAFDYYVKQPVGRGVEVASNPIRKMRLELPQFIEEAGGSTPKGVAAYGSYKVGNAYRANVDIPIKSFMQEGFRTPRGAGTQPIVPDKMLPFDAGTPASRMGTKTVGGRQVTSLAREPSLKSMGINERPFDTSSGGSGKGFASSRSIDFRGKQPSTMKPMKESSYGYQGKQASGQMQIFSEQIQMPQTSARVAPQRMQTPYSMFKGGQKGAVSEMEPELMFSPTSRTRQYYSQQENPILASISMVGLGQGLRTGTTTSVQQRARQGQALSMFSSIQSATPRQTQQQVRSSISKRDSLYGFGVGSITGMSSMQKTRQGTALSSWQSELTGYKTSSMQRTVLDQKSWLDITSKPITTTVPATIPLPFFGGGGAGGMFGGRKGKIAWREKIPMQNVLLTKGKPLIKMPSMNLPKQRPAKKTSRRKKSMWGW